MSFINTNPKGVQTPTPAGLVPTFLPASMHLIGDYSFVDANSLYWASPTTAAELAVRFGAKAVQKPAFFDMTWRGETFSPSDQWYLEFPGTGNGPVFVNAGELAGYFQRNPEAQFPQLAEKMVRQILVAEGALSA